MRIKEITNANETRVAPSFLLKLVKEWTQGHTALFDQITTTRFNHFTDDNQKSWFGRLSKDNI